MVADEAHFKGNAALFRKTHCWNNPRVGYRDYEVDIGGAFLSHGPTHSLACHVHMLPKHKAVRPRKINMFKHAVFSFNFVKRKK